MLPASISVGRSIDVAKQNIATFRGVNENVSQEALSSLALQKSDSIEAIKFSQVVHDFNGAAKKAILRAEKLLVSNTATVPPGELEALIAEVPER